jgi:hypothetical protein
MTPPAEKPSSISGNNIERVNFLSNMIFSSKILLSPESYRHSDDRKPEISEIYVLLCKKAHAPSRKNSDRQLLEDRLLGKIPSNELQIAYFLIENVEQMLLGEAHGAGAVKNNS